jgi:hypothetical protein
MVVGQIGQVVAVTFKNRYWDHYGILDGKGGIIHVNKKEGKIVLDPWAKILSKAIKVKYFDDNLDIRLRSYDRALRQIGTIHKYHLISGNCESWVNTIRYDECRCSQLDSIASWISYLIVGYSAVSSFSK